MKPTIGRQVRYRSRTGNYTLTATITATTETLWREGVERGDVPDLSSETHVHLEVLTPGKQGRYQEHDVPLYDVAEHGATHAPGTWMWPVIERPSEVVG